jgi:hypothetical protein
MPIGRGDESFIKVPFQVKFFSLPTITYQHNIKEKRVQPEPEILCHPPPPFHQERGG